MSTKICVHVTLTAQNDALGTDTEATHPDLSGIDGHTISDEFPGEEPGLQQREWMLLQSYLLCYSSC